MPISDDDRRLALNSAAELLDGIEENFRTVEEIKAKYPHIPTDVMEYIEASAQVFKQMTEQLIMSNETILKYDDVVNKTIALNQEKEGEG